MEMNGNQAAGPMEMCVRSEQLRAAIYGVAVGDALGVPYEFCHRGDFRCSAMIGGGTHGRPAGTFSDDTSMTLATLDSLKHHEWRVDAHDMLERFRDWRYRGAYTSDGCIFDVGRTTDEALRSGIGGDDEFDNGNGSLMRMIPLAFADVDDEDVRRASAITHAHPISMEACVRYVALARLLMRGTPVRRALGAIGFDGVWNLKRDQIQSGGFVLHTLQAACWCLSTTDSYASCVLTAVNLGEDTDTTAAVAGGLAGIVHGIAGPDNPQGIPAAWIDALFGKQVIDSVLDGCPDA